jgi:cysteine desulfurase
VKFIRVISVIKISGLMTKIYLDYAATTPLDKRVLTEMEPYLKEKFGNPNSLHWAGQQAQGAIDLARKGVADFLGAKMLGDRGQ